MQITYDKTADALYLKLKRGKVIETKAGEDYLVDYDEKRNIIGVEILDYSEKLLSKPLKK